MALKKKIPSDDAETVENQRDSTRDIAGLITALSEGNVTARRWAARDLLGLPEATPALLAALNVEKEQVVREAILDSLEKIKGEDVTNGLIPILRSEDAALRNGVIEVLQSMPGDVALHIIELLNDQDSDVRIFAIDILQVLAHPETPQWLLSVLKDETHINVVATAVDRLAEVGTPEMIPDLEALKSRFPGEAYLDFAVRTAIKRIEG